MKITKDNSKGAWSIPIALTARYLAHSIMLFLALLHERIPGHKLNDALLNVTPYVAIIDRFNYIIWLFCYIPIALWLWKKNRQRFIQFLYLGALLSLIRGVAISFVAIGPVRGGDINVGMSYTAIFDAWIAIINPVSALFGNSTHIYLTKDLFFSGHVATTFLLFLFTLPYKKMATVALIAHLIVVGVVFFSHLHYTIDVIGAWVITYLLFMMYKKWVSLNENRSR